MKPALYLMMGCPGCGKSYYAKMIQDAHDDFSLVSRDAIRFGLLKDGEDYFAKEEEVIATFFSIINRKLQNGHNVIADATHITRRSRNSFFKHIKNLDDIRVVGVWVEAPLHVALERNSKRKGRARVPEDVIKNAYRVKVSPQEDEPFDDIVFISSNVNMCISKSHPEIKEVNELLKVI